MAVCRPRLPRSPLCDPRSPVSDISGAFRFLLCKPGVVKMFKMMKGTWGLGQSCAQAPAVQGLAGNRALSWAWLTLCSQAPGCHFTDEVIRGHRSWATQEATGPPVSGQCLSLQPFLELSWVQVHDSGLGGRGCP